ncbi:cell wall-binding repeat-containing protein [Peptostreptococcus sp. D1]|uniref:cell wall-binding repeat-containing protein n=1 Tax=Peptostreptococcus sp. D1 TaxID=72304 RepID=UPI0008E12587|nr:cell wall-binding repeat-containing protein [Peptostreptococcus sp. D1]SFE26956.1 Leucine Rich repeat-containing protein [Peptostreptococcus sp. D1]
MKKSVSVLMSAAILTNSAINSSVFAETIANEMWGVSYPDSQMIVEASEFLKDTKNTEGENVVEDANLRYMINIMYKREGTEEQLKEIPVTAKMVQNLRILSPEQCKAHNLNEKLFMLNSLKGLEYAENLEWLSLVNQQEDSIEPLRGLKKLKFLDIRNNNNLKDLSPLENITSLESLNIHTIKVDNFDFLSKLVKLKYLDAFSCQSNDISGLKNLTNLKYLDISRNTFDNIESLSNMKNLESLNISKSAFSLTDMKKVVSLDPIKEATKLRFLDASSNEISDIRALSNMSNLEELYMNNNLIKDWSPVNKLPKLKNVFSSGNPVEFSKNNGDENSTYEGDLPQMQDKYTVEDVVNPEMIIVNDKDEIKYRLPKTVNISIKKVESEETNNGSSGNTNDSSSDNQNDISADNEKDIAVEGSLENRKINYIVRDTDGKIVKIPLKFEATTLEAGTESSYTSVDGIVSINLTGMMRDATIELKDSRYELVSKNKFTETYDYDNGKVKYISKLERDGEVVRPVYDENSNVSLPEGKNKVLELTVREKIAESSVEDLSKMGVNKNRITYVIKDKQGQIITDEINFTVEDEEGFYGKKQKKSSGGYLEIEDNEGLEAKYVVKVENPYFIDINHSFDTKYASNKNSITRVYKGDLERKDVTEGVLRATEDNKNLFTITLDRFDENGGVLDSNPFLPPLMVSGLYRSAISSVASSPAQPSENILGVDLNEAINTNKNDELLTEVITKVNWTLNLEESREDDGIYVYNGTLELPEGISNPKNITAKIIVRVEKKVDAKLDNNSGTGVKLDNDKINIVSSQNIAFGYTSNSKANVDRVSGKDRIQTSVELSKKYYKKSDTVIIVNGFKFPDGLVSSSLSSAIKAPILLIDGNSINDSIRDEISRLGAKNIIFVGGEASINTEMVSLMKKDYSVEVISGKDRFETSNAVFDKLKSINKIGKKAVVVSGENYSDALVSATIAASEVTPIILARKNEISKDALNRLSSSDEITIVGGDLSVSKDVENRLRGKVNRIAGENRYETSVLVSKFVYPSSKSVFVSSGDEYADTLALGGILPTVRQPIVLTSKLNKPKVLQEYLEKMENITIVGGIGAINFSQFNK